MYSNILGSTAGPLSSGEAEGGGVGVRCGLSVQELCGSADGGAEAAGVGEEAGQDWMRARVLVMLREGTPPSHLRARRAVLWAPLP